MWDSGFQDIKFWYKGSIPIQIGMKCDKICSFLSLLP